MFTAFKGSSVYIAVIFSAKNVTHDKINKGFTESHPKVGISSASVFFGDGVVGLPPLRLREGR